MTDQPLIAIDVVPVSFSTVDGLQFGLATRQFEPYAGQPALPGVLLTGGERLADAAYRAARSKGGIAKTQVAYLTQIGTFDGPGRDPRDEAISVSYLAVTRPGAGKIIWRPTPADLPFDHDSIVGAAREQMRVRLWSDAAFTRALLGETFTTVDAANLEAELTGVKPRQSNLLRKLAADARLHRLPEGRAFGRGKPVAVWSWV